MERNVTSLSISALITETHISVLCVLGEFVLEFSQQKKIRGMLVWSFLSTRDIGKVVEALYGENPPPIMMIGHSMGGAIAVHTAAANHVPSLLGLCVIDVVEGECLCLLSFAYMEHASSELHSFCDEWRESQNGCEFSCSLSLYWDR